VNRPSSSDQPGGQQRPPGVLRVGDRVVVDGQQHTIVGLSGPRVRLLGDDGAAQVVLLSYLLASGDLRLLDAPPAQPLPPFGLLDSLPDGVADRARSWQRHVTEVLTGLPPDASAGQAPRPEYDPARHTLAEREAAKASELCAAGQPTSAWTVGRMRRRYQTQGLWGLVDQRATRQPTPYGHADPRVITAIGVQLDLETEQSTGTRERLRRRVTERLAAEHGPGAVPLPSRATFNRLVEVLAHGRYTFGSARSRRSAANRPARPFTRTQAARPGEQVFMDSTRLDVRAVWADGVKGEVELTIAVDIATRTICAAVLRPEATKAVDAALLLARTLVPEPMRPGWSDTLALAHARLPYQRLVDIDGRLAAAAARPVIVPDTITVDHGKVFTSRTFLTACALQGISVQLARKATPTDKAIVERTFDSLKTLFCQHVRGYTGGRVEHRGVDPDADPLWSIADLQDLLDEWLVAGWQQRPHDELRDPMVPRRALSPNEIYAAMVAVAGYVPVPLTGDDYIELLPVEWRTINEYGVQRDYRTYDCEQLNPYRRQPSGVPGKATRWEVHYDPDNSTCVWVRNHHAGGWITVPWTHLAMVGEPFAEFTWRYARRRADQAQGGHADESAVAATLAAILARADHGPASPTARDAADRRIVARTRASRRGWLAAGLPIDLGSADDPVDTLDSGGQPGGSDPAGLASPAPLPAGLFEVFDPAAETQGEPW
jgi:transposase InsO family protein